jgi:ribosomal protein S17E
MGRIKTQLIKRTTMKLLNTHRKSFTKDFEDNKKVVQELLNFPGKKIRNIIAGYAARIVRNEKEI